MPDAPVTCEVDKGRRLARRYMAWLSFFFLLCVGLSIMYGVIWSPDPVTIASALSTASPVLTTVCGFFTTIVLGYLGVSVAEKILKK